MHSLILWLGLAFTNPTYEQPPLEIKPVMVWTGIDSKQTKESFARCCSQKEWVAMWHEHQGHDKETDTRTCPQIDFTSYMVIAVFHGESDQNNGIGITSIAEEKDCLRVRYKPSWYQVICIPGRPEPSYATQSYVFVVLPRTQKAILLEEDVGNYHSPVWKERTKLAASGK